MAEVGKRVPFWSLLLGIYLAAGFWTLPPNVGTAVNGALFVLIVGSLTFLCAGRAAGLAHEYGHTVQEALPITTLTENVVRIAVMTVGFLIILNGLDYRSPRFSPPSGWVGWRSRWRSRIRWPICSPGFTSR